MNWLTKPPRWLVIAAAVLALWPMFPAPYLIIKLNALLGGEPLGTVEVLRLLLHGGALAFLMAMSIRLMLLAQRGQR